MTEPDGQAYVLILDGAGGRVYKRMDWLADGLPARWFRLAGDNPHGVPVRDSPALTWDEVQAVGPVGFVGTIHRPPSGRG